MIIADKIIKNYNGNRILNEISLELKRKEITVLFGPSGCGKTTLCRNLTMLEYPDSGTLKVDEQFYQFPAKNSFPVMPYPRVNMVFQQLFLWPHLTNEQNIKLAIDDLNKEKNERFDYLTKLLEIDEILNQYPNESSLGQKQRVAIARVLILDPEFIFFDEMTSSLDIVQTNIIIELLLKLKADGIGILIITHNINFMERVADNLLFMYDGKIIETGNTNIIKQPKTEILKQFLGI